jgi:serine/threonine protein kinase
MIIHAKQIYPTESTESTTFQLGKLLGSGSSAHVYTTCLNDEVLAMKIYKNAYKWSCIDDEVRYMKLFDHPNIVKLRYIFTTNRVTYILQEMIDGPDLFDIFRNDSTRLTQSEETIKRYFSQLISAVKYMHSKSIAHQDIKLENILLDTASNSIKLIDFGLSTDLRTSIGLVGTADCMAPEIAENIHQYDTFLSDTWSCGIVLYEMFVGEAPYEECLAGEIYKAIVNEDIIYPETLSASALDLLKGLLTKDPTKRMTLDQASLHPYLTQ